MNRIHADSVEAAVALANQLKNSGGRWWFRGQAKDWPVRSSFCRVPCEKKDEILRKLARFDAWVKSTPGLEKLAKDTDSIIAVAQHYALPTNFVDFTTSPEIAAYFATEKADASPPGELACLVCIDLDDLMKFWGFMGGEYAPIELIELEVPDLWRLEAQHGRFLYCPYSDIERIYDFDRIYFPKTHRYPMIHAEEIYPTRKSHLEILLDQYFMNEYRLENYWKPPENVTQFEVVRPNEHFNPVVFPEGIPQHSTWAAECLRGWIAPPQESLVAVRTAVRFNIDVTEAGHPEKILSQVADQLLSDLMPLTGIRKKLVNWTISGRGGPLPQEVIENLPARLARLWDGLRMLPYLDEDVCAGVAMCVALGITLRGDFFSSDASRWKQAVAQCLHDPIHVEFGAADGSYSRGYVSNSALAGAVRPELAAFAAPEWKQPVKSNPVSVLQSAWTPSQTFDFNRLSRLFASEIAPYQVLSRTTAVFFSPARLDTFGLP